MIWANFVCAWNLQVKRLSIWIPRYFICEHWCTTWLYIRMVACFLSYQAGYGFSFLLKISITALQKIPRHFIGVLMHTMLSAIVKQSHIRSVNHTMGSIITLWHTGIKLLRRTFSTAGLYCRTNWISIQESVVLVYKTQFVNAKFKGT